MRFDNPFAALAAQRDSLAPAPADSATPAAEGRAAPAVRETFPSRWVVRIERAGRGGKTVTLLESPGLSPEELRKVADAIKRALGCGASTQEGGVVLQGALEERAAAWLRDRGATKVVLGTRARPRG